jgi:hypothetical protein
MCIDYTSLNKTCPKDEYPLSQICQIVVPHHHQIR